MIFAPRAQYLRACAVSAFAGRVNENCRGVRKLQYLYYLVVRERNYKKKS